jgi:hypothetical protein
VELGISLEAQAEKIRAIALVQGAELSEIIVESGESAKGLNRPGMAKLLAMGALLPRSPVHSQPRCCQTQQASLPGPLAPSWRRSILRPAPG